MLCVCLCPVRVYAKIQFCLQQMNKYIIAEMDRLNGLAEVFFFLLAQHCSQTLDSYQVNAAAAAAAVATSNERKKDKEKND